MPPARPSPTQPERAWHSDLDPVAVLRDADGDRWVQFGDAHDIRGRVVHRDPSQI